MDPLIVTVVVIVVMLLAVLAGLWTRRLRRELHPSSTLFGVDGDTSVFRLSEPWKGARTVYVSEWEGQFVVLNPWTSQVLARVAVETASTPAEAMRWLGFTTKGA